MGGRRHRPRWAPESASGLPEMESASGGGCWLRVQEEGRQGRGPERSQNLRGPLRGQDRAARRLQRTHVCKGGRERERGRERDWVAWVCEICHVRACVWCVSVRACGRGDAPPAATVSARGRAWALPLGKSATTIGSLAGLCGFIGALGAAHLSRDSVGFEGGLAGGAGDEHKTL